MALRDIRADLKERIADVAQQLVAEHAQYIEDLERRELKYKLSISVLERDRAVFEKLLELEQEREEIWPNDRSDTKWVNKMKKNEEFLRSLKLCEDVSELLTKLHNEASSSNVHELTLGQVKSAVAG